jgi:hypothetical protein
LFSFDSIEKFENYSLNEVIFDLEKSLIYVTTNQDENKKIKVLKIKLSQKSEVEITEVGLNGHGFKIDFNDENKIYFIEENVVYCQEFEKKEKGIGSLFSGGLGLFGTTKEPEEGVKNLYGAEEFFRSKFDLKFIIFEKDMQHFYCDDTKNLKRYQTVNKEVVNVYDDVIFKPTDMFLSSDESLLYRYKERI